MGKALLRIPRRWHTAWMSRPCCCYAVPRGR